MMQRVRNPWLMRLLRGKWAEETQPCTLGATPKRGLTEPVSTTPQLRDACLNEVEHGAGPFRLLGARRQAGFSLGELLAVVIIGSMILVAILTIYGRASQAADAVLRKMDSPAWTSEVLQLIAEDLGRTLSADDVTVQIRNGFDNGFQRAELVLRRTYHDSENKEQTLEQIAWRAGYDHEGRTPGLVIYRSYEGVAQEDKLLDDNRDEVEKFSPFVPICRGVTFFQIQACKGEELVDQWPASPPPTGVKITISFGKPYERVRGGLDVDEQDKVSRTVAIAPMRKIAFAMAGRADANGVPDPNAASPDKQSTQEPSSGGQPPREPPANERRMNGQTTTPTRSR
jgi:type II secretory pathway pseudopilin PulG